MSRYGSIVLMALSLLSTSAADAIADQQSYDQPVQQPAAQAQAKALLEKAANDLGLGAAFEGCRLFEQVSNGTRGGERAYGAVCKLALGGRAQREFVVCTSKLSGGFDLYSGSFVNTPTWMADFIRRNCY